MPKNELATILPRPDSRSTDAIVRRWIVVIAELCSKELTTSIVELWCELLSEIEPELLERALEETAKTCRFFPTPGEVRARIGQAKAGALELEAQTAWQHVLKFVERSPWSGIKELDSISQHAARAAGGLTHIERCSYGELEWARKRFLETYKLLHDSGRIGHLLGDGHAKKILREIAAHSEPPRYQPLAPKEEPERSRRPR